MDGIVPYEPATPPSSRSRWPGGGCLAGSAARGEVRASVRAASKSVAAIASSDGT